MNLARLILARESKDLRQQDMADKLNMPKSTYHRIEKQELQPPGNLAIRAAEITGYPLSFFHAPGIRTLDPIGSRRRLKVAQSYINRNHANVHIIRLHVEQLTSELHIKPPKLPRIEITETFTPADAAKRLRQLWHLPEAPIDNLTDVVEKHGIPVYTFPFSTERLDSHVIYTEDNRPIIFINATHTADRQRFSLAYQLAHVVLKFLSGRDEDENSHEANRFAAEFLMSEKGIREDLKDVEHVTFSLLGDLKSRWKTSMISLLYRTVQHGFTTENQKRYLINQLNEQKLRRLEPIDFPREQPKLIREWLAIVKEKNKLNTEGLAAHIHLTKEQFLTRYR